MPEPSDYLSEIEKEILRSTVPIKLSEEDEIIVFGERGLWANKLEVLNWKSDMPIEKYQLNEDHNPEIIVKKLKDSIEYIHEIAIRYLKPPSPPSAGEIIISQEPNTFTPPAPPLIIRQQPPRPSTPEPLVIREAPPVPPDTSRKVITISGKQLPPPPRKVVVERLAPMPPKPQSVIIERWLPYTQKKRKVIYKGAPPDPVLYKPKNIIVQWEAPEIEIKKQVKYLGVVEADPEEYMRRYGPTLKKTSELPPEVLEIKYPPDLLEHMKNSSMLEGDVDALKLVDLEKEGLAIYRDYLTQIGILDEKKTSTSALSSKSSKSTKSTKSNQTLLNNSNNLNSKNEEEPRSKNSTPDILEAKLTDSFIKPTESIVLNQDFTSRASSVLLKSRQSTSSVDSISQSIKTTSVYAEKPSTPQGEPKQNSNKKSPLPPNWKGSYEGSDEYLRNIFNFMDYDQDGQVKLEEVKRVLDVLNEKFKRNYIELSAIVFLNTFDRNKDGHIDFDEFKQSIREILDLK